MTTKRISPFVFDDDKWLCKTISAGKCPYCKKEMVKHIIKEGARYHVTSYYTGKNGSCSHCSEPDCENNHGPGHCVPFSADPNHGLQFKEQIEKIFEDN